MILEERQNIMAGIFESMIELFRALFVLFVPFFITAVFLFFAIWIILLFFPHERGWPHYPFRANRSTRLRHARSQAIKINKEKVRQEWGKDLTFEPDMRDADDPLAFWRSLIDE